MRKSNVFILWLTPIYIWIAQLTAYLHEYGHSFTAWLLGLKADPLDIIYGGWGWKNLMLLANIDENVNYILIDQLGHRELVSLIAFAGPAISALIYLITLFILRRKLNSYLYGLVLWVNLVNVRELWAYVPLRALSTTSDIANINHSLNLSPWWIFVIITPFTTFAVLNFFVNTLANAYKNLGLYNRSAKTSLLIITMTYFFTLTGFQILSANYNFITNALTWSSFLAIPFLLLDCWPKKG